MQRFICLLLLSIIPVVTMAKTDYPIAEELRSACRMTAPLGKGALSVGNFFLGIMPKGMRSDEELTIEKVKITTTTNGKTIGAWVITPVQGADSLRSAILFLHGGGFVFKAAPYHYDLAKEYARRSGSVVVMVDYRTAHNTPYGTPLQDCVDAWRWMHNNAAHLGIDTGKCAIVGDSAGGFLTVKTALVSGVMPSKLMLIYPVIDCSMRTASMALYDDTPVWNSVLNKRMWEYYLQGEQESSLLDLEAEQLRAFPATYIETAEFDCLRDEGEEFATLLCNAGVPTTYVPTEGTMHGFDMAQRSAITTQCITERCEWLAE